MQASVTVTHIGHEVALPFIAAYATRWRLPYNDDGADEVLWWGAWLDNSVRAVMGLQDAYENSLLVYGLYGDGSPGEIRAIVALSKVLDALPQELHGVIHLPNARMYRAAGKHGWQISRLLPEHYAAMVHRPRAEAV